MKNSEKSGMGKKIAIFFGVWLLLGIIASVFIVLNSPKDSLQQKMPVEVKTDTAETVEPSLPAFKKESGLSEAEKLRNPLIVNHTGLVQVVTNLKGERLGVAQIVKLSEKDFDSITAKNLKDFWLECNFDGWQWVWILESNSEGYTGRAMQITGNGSVARYGYINAFEDEGIDFGKFHEIVREFFYLSDEKDFQYFNLDDPDDEGLKRFKDSDRVFAAKIN
ncbi:MAG: hypothetical protein II821_04895 [Treponema sp.]|nr:hypothetical protein [Treponema sp.]